MDVNHGGNGGHVPPTGDTSPEFVLRGTAMMFVPPEFSTYNVYLTTRYAIYLYLFAHGIMYYTAFNAGSV